MTKVAAVGGYQAKVALVQGEQGELALDGAERAGDTWRPVPVELRPEAAAELRESLDAFEPAPSALHVLLAESLPPKYR